MREKVQSAKHELRVAVVSPHPDDAEYAVGGIIARATELGIPTNIICMKLAQPDLRRTFKSHPREREARRAAAKLGCGIEFIECNPYDARVQSVENITRVIRKTRPRIVIVNDENDMHPFHRDVARIVFEAIFWARVPRVMLGDTQTWQTDQLFFYSAYSAMPFRPDVFVDVSKVFRKAKEALLQHKLGLEIAPGLDYKMSVEHLHHGAAAGVQYAEAMRISHEGWFDTIPCRSVGLDFISTLNKK